MAFRSRVDLDPGAYPLVLTLGSSLGAPSGWLLLSLLAKTLASHWKGANDLTVLDAPEKRQPSASHCISLYSWSQAALRPPKTSMDMDDAGQVGDMTLRFRISLRLPHAFPAVFLTR
jgi:hypothetical protein